MRLSTIYSIQSSSNHHPIIVIHSFSRLPCWETRSKTGYSTYRYRYRYPCSSHAKCPCSTLSSLHVHRHSIHQLLGSRHLHGHPTSQIKSSTSAKSIQREREQDQKPVATGESRPRVIPFASTLHYLCNVTPVHQAPWQNKRIPCSKKQLSQSK